MNKLILIFLFFPVVVFSQNRNLRIINSTTGNIILNKLFYDSISITDFTDEFILKKNLKGYISAGYDSIITDSINTNYYYNSGKKYFWKEISIKGIPDVVMRKISVNKKTFNNKSINSKKFLKSIKKILSYYENNGYPFATVKLDSVNIIDNYVYANLIVKKNNFIVINNINFNNQKFVSKNFLLKYLGINKFDIYSEKNLGKINNRINNLNFVKQTKPIQIIFSNDSADLKINIAKKNANKFNGMLGFLPDNKLGKINLTGELSLSLLNPFKHAEEIEFNWQKLDAMSQELNSKIMFPYIFKTNIGIKAKFNLLKKDTSYLNTNPYLSFMYFFSANNYVNIFYQNQTSSIISTYGLENLTVLPDYADFSSNIYGFGIFVNNLDYLYNPHKGVLFETSFGIGEKTIHRNSKINKLLYDNIDLNSKSINSEIKLNIYYPVYKDLVIKYRNNSAIINNSNMFLNEMYQLGGISTIRGFDEKSILASAYTISSVELRYLFERNSAVYGFFDYCYYQQKTKNIISDTPFGFGVGVDFETKIGIFTIDYALGSQKGNQIMINSAKIHFGYLNRF